MMRYTTALVAAAVIVFAVAGSPRAQSDRDMAQMQLYIQQLEEQVRMLTGENERLLHELRTLQSRMGAAQGGTAAGSTQMPADTAGSAQMPPDTVGSTGGGGASAGEIAGATMAPPADDAAGGQLGAPPRDLGTLIITEGGDTIAADGEQPSQPAIDQRQVAAGAPADGSEPVDLTALAGGIATLSETPTDAAPQVGAAPEPQVQAALPAGSRQAYDVAYGYVLTGDYNIAEEQFRAWLGTFPGDPQAPDARFWLGESQFQQGKHREAANTLLALYREAPNSRKAPDALMKLGMALAALGEQSAACSTFGEIAKRHPDAPASVTTRAAAEAERAGC